MFTACDFPFLNFIVNLPTASFLCDDVAESRYAYLPKTFSPVFSDAFSLFESAIGSAEGTIGTPSGILSVGRALNFFAAAIFFPTLAAEMSIGNVSPILSNSQASLHSRVSENFSPPSTRKLVCAGFVGDTLRQYSPFAKSAGIWRGGNLFLFPKNVQPFSLSNPLSRSVFPFNFTSSKYAARRLGASSGWRVR